MATVQRLHHELSTCAYKNTQFYSLPQSVSILFQRTSREVYLVEVLRDSGMRQRIPSSGYSFMSTLPSRQNNYLFPIRLIHLTSLSFSSLYDTLSLISPGYNAVLTNIIMCYLVRPIQLSFSWGWLSLCHRQRPQYFLKLELRLAQSVVS